MSDSPHGFRVGGATILALALVAVEIGALLYMMSLDVTAYHTWRVVADLDAAGALLILGGVLFPIATLPTCQRDEVHSPGIRDHFRQCALLYAMVALFVAAIWPRRWVHGGSLAFAISALIASSAVVGLTANGITLALRRTQNPRAAE